MKRRESCSVSYVELLSDVRTRLAALLSSLLSGYFVVALVGEAYIR